MFHKRQKAIWLINNVKISLDYMEGYTDSFYARPQDKKNILWFDIENIESKKDLGF